MESNDPSLSDKPSSPSTASPSPTGSDPPPGSPPSPEPSLPSDTDEIRDVMQRLKLVLDETINAAESLTTSELTVELRHGWPEIVRAFNNVDQELASGLYVTKLEEAGLTGTSWKVKLKGFRRAFSNMLRAGKDKLRESTRSVLRWGNIILGSLASVLPPAEIIKEFKECVEADLEEQHEIPSPKTPAS